MALFADLSPYTYGDSEHLVDEQTRRPVSRALPSRLLNVGWIDVSGPYVKRQPSHSFIRALTQAVVSERRQQTRGYQECPEHLDRYPIEYCLEDGWPTTVDHYCASPLRLGSAEVWVTSPEGVVFAAPNLVLHYVLEHHYSPPEEFVRATLLAFGDEKA